MNKAVAFSNNDTVFLSWTYDKAIPGCLGFAIYRLNESGTRTPLPAWVGFRGDKNIAWQPKDTTQWPIQKFSWRDFEAQQGQTYSYEIVPLGGTKAKLIPIPNVAPLPTNKVTLTPERGSFSAYFNRGILSTQAVSRSVPKGPSGGPNPVVLRNRIDQPGDPLRQRLAGQILEALTSLLNKADKDGGSCFLALYELNDPDLLTRLLAAKSKIHLILSNTGTDDAENTPARQALHEAGADVIDRMLSNGHIGHNKFCLYVDANDTPKAVITGSTNWSFTGVCAQSNNTLIINDDQIAQAYFDYWKRLKADGENDPLQAPALRQADTQSVSATVDTAAVTVWYSPNTKQMTKPSKNPATPPDMVDVFHAMAQAKYGIVQYAAACENAKPGLLVYGAATDPQASEEYNSVLIHRTTNDVVTLKDPVISATGLNTQFEYWIKELTKLPGGHAIIHDKIIVIDPLSDDCVVITGSHNLGYRASYNNDENLVIIRGHNPLAQAYLTHIMDIYDHYRWRFTVQDQGKSSFSGLDPTPKWQDKYFVTNSSARRESLFWTGQSQPCPDAPAPAVPQGLGPAAAVRKTAAPTKTRSAAKSRRVSHARTPSTKRR